MWSVSRPKGRFWEHLGPPNSIWTTATDANGHWLSPGLTGGARAHHTQPAVLFQGIFQSSSLHAHWPSVPPFPCPRHRLQRPGFLSFFFIVFLFSSWFLSSPRHCLLGLIWASWEMLQPIYRDKHKNKLREVMCKDTRDCSSCACN